MKPFLKWVGGKQKIIRDIIESFPRDIDTYHEPFLGGGSVLFALLESDITVNRIRVNDANEHLIRTFVDVRDNLAELIREVKTLKNDEESYYKYRAEFNDLKKKSVLSVRTSALFIYLNKTGFRGLYREGPNGMNVPFGHYKNPTVIDKVHLARCSEALKHVEFFSMSYEKFLVDVGEKDFVYLDPPYVPEKTTSFTKYNVYDFLDHEAFFDTVKSLPRFSMSNSKTSPVESAFPVDEYDVAMITCPRAINSKNPGMKIVEVLIKNRFSCRSTDTS